MEFSKSLNLEETITHAGKTLRLAGMTPEVRGQWEKWQRERGWEELQQLRSIMAPEEYPEARSDFLRDCAAGKYSFFSPMTRKSLETFASDGQRQMLFIRLRVNHPEADEKFIWEIIDEKADELLAKMQLTDADDPNSKAPAGKTPGPDVSGSSPSVPSSPANPTA